LYPDTLIYVSDAIRYREPFSGPSTSFHDEGWRQGSEDNGNGFEQLLTDPIASSLVEGGMYLDSDGHNASIFSSSCSFENAIFSPDPIQLRNLKLHGRWNSYKVRTHGYDLKLTSQKDM
jgi:hypothetical protein